MSFYNQRQISNCANLCQAISSRNETVIRDFILNDADINICDEEGNTPLHLAIIKSININILTMLLDKGADIHARNHDDFTALDLAIVYNDAYRASLLIEKGALVGEDVSSLIFTAVEQQNDRIVKAIVDCGMQDNPSINLITHLKIAISRGNPEMIEAIIPHCGFSQPSDLYIPDDLVMYCDVYYKESIELLSKWNFTIHPDSYNDEDFIYEAVKKGHLPIVVQLLEHGIDVDMVNSKTGLNLLTIACLNGHHEIVEKFLEHNADVNVKISSAEFEEISNHYPWFYYYIDVFKSMFSLDDDKNNLIDVTCLHIAVFKADLIATDILLKYGTRINNSDLLNLTCIAIINGCEEIVNKFLDCGVKTTDIHPNGKTLLHFCVGFDYHHEQDSSYNVAKLLLERGANIHLQTPANSLVFEAIKNRHRKIAQRFLDNNANIEYISPDGHTSLHKAIKNRFDTKFIKTLLKLNSPINTVNREGHTSFLDACIYTKKDQLEIIETLLHHNADVNCANHNLKTPLQIASCRGDLEVVKALLNKGANPHAVDDKGETPLHYVSRSKRDMTASIIQLLLEHGANIEAVDAKGWTPLFTACKEGNTEVVKCLLENHANLHATDNEGQTACHVVCTSWNDMTPAVIQLLLEHGANIESVDKQGWTPLFIACKHNNCKAAKCLLDNHANPNATDNEGQTPLHIVCKLDCCGGELLLENGANIEAVDKRGWTPLFHACYYHNYEAIELLLDYYANPNHRDFKNSTPLHIAIEQACVPVDYYKICKSVDLLIEYGANVDVLDEKNRNPLHAAVEKRIFYSDDNLTHAPLIRENYEEVIEILVLHKIKLKAAGLEISHHNSNVVFNPDDYITIDNIRYSANDILQLNVESNDNDVAN